MKLKQIRKFQKVLNLISSIYFGNKYSKLLQLNQDIFKIQLFLFNIEDYLLKTYKKKIKKKINYKIQKKYKTNRKIQKIKKIQKIHKMEQKIFGIFRIFKDWFSISLIYNIKFKYLNNLCRNIKKF